MDQKPLIFLHVYHHIVTLFICWCCLLDLQSVQWIAIIANTLVHIPMYYFYASQSIGVDIKWKKHITKFQIVQFVFDILSSSSWGVLALSGPQCRGTWFTFWAAMFIFTTFLYLFVGFFRNTYKGQKDH